MKLKKYITVYLVLLFNLCLFAQQYKVKKADNLFNKFAFVDAAEAYKDLINKDYQADYASRRLADCYTFMRNPDSALVYYQKTVEQPNIPIEYYYKYAQALRGVKNYKESRVWLKKFKKSGGKLKDVKFLKDDNFITSIFNAKPNYFLSNVDFNSKYSDFGAYEHQNKIYYTSAQDEGVSTKHLYSWNKEPFLDVYVIDKDAKTSKPFYKSKLQGDVNSIYHDGPVTISPDGKTMYFSRNNFVEKTLKKDKKGISNLKIYKASLIDSLWTNVEELNFNSDEYSCGHPALNRDGTKLYFASDMPGSLGGSDIFYVDMDSNGNFGDPINLGDVVNTDENEVFPFINNEDVLFFSSEGHPGLGLLDVFATSTNKNKDIVSVINLGIPVNSSKDDFSFTMNADGLTGYFASNRRGGKGSDDIYAYNRIPDLKVEGFIIDAVNSKPIAKATVTLYDDSNNEITKIESDDLGFYSITIERDNDFVITAEKNKFITGAEKFTSKKLKVSDIKIKQDIILNPIEDVVLLAELNTIYFDFDKYNIRPDAAKELDKVVNLMTNEYPKMIIKLESYTDSRGTDAYNIDLSVNRAKSTYNYLISKGIKPERILSYEGFGEQKLTNDCDGSKNCLESQHQLNRRTQFIIIKMK